MVLNLIKKELRLQIHHLYFAMSLVGIWLFLLLIALAGGRENSMNMFFQIMHYFIVIPGLLFVIPTLMGCESIAVEHHMQTIERQFSLPIPADFQYGVKILVTTVLAMTVCCSLTTVLDASMDAYQEAVNTHVFQTGTNWHWHPVCILLFVGIGIYSSSFLTDALSAFIHSLAFFSFTVFLSHLAFFLTGLFLLLIDYDGKIEVYTDYAILEIHKSQRNLPLNQSVNPLYLLLFYFRIILCSVTLFGFGYSNFQIACFSKTRYCLHAIIWTGLIVTLTFLVI